MKSLSRLALAALLPLLAACTVYTPAEYRFLEETRADSARGNRAAAAPVHSPGRTGDAAGAPAVRHGVRRSPAMLTPVSLEESRTPRAPADARPDPEPTQG